MKKKILAGMLAAAVTGMLLSGCGKKSEVQPGLGKEALQEETGNEALQEETGNEALQEETGKEALQEETENEAGLKEETDWFSEKGLAVTPQGDFAFTYSVHGTENYQSMSWPGDFAIQGKESTTGSVTITENLVDDHKEVVFQFKYDESGLERYYDELPADVEDPYGQMRQSAFSWLCFDRDTGYRLSCGAGQAGLVVGGTSVPWDAIRSVEGGCLEYLGNMYDLWGEDEYLKEAVFYTASLEKQGTERILELTVYCPADYDGAVFGVRDWAQETGQAVEMIEGFDYDRGVRPTHGEVSSLERMSDYPVDGLIDEEYLFFTLTNE
ncbi:MAG: hypothetical protein HFI35_05675 [Roseburia sp.]|jgi:hypothetical protein|nr:hypothetical protein [Roseburia sp.]